MAELAALPGLEMEGVISHLALADEAGHPFTATQVERFREALAQVRGAGFAPRLVHLSNSAAIFGRDCRSATWCAQESPSTADCRRQHLAGRIDLRPVMSLHTTIAQLKTVPAGTGISYGHRFVAARPTLIAALPVGYADGYSRRLSGCGEVLVRGRRAPIAGTVCMDWTMADVSDIPGVAVGDRVTLLGRDGGEQITAEEWAGRIGTISYEVFCLVGPRVPRIYVNADR